MLEYEHQRTPLEDWILKITKKWKNPKYKRLTQKTASATSSSSQAQIAGVSSTSSTHCRRAPVGGY